MNQKLKISWAWNCTFLKTVPLTEETASLAKEASAQTEEADSLSEWAGNYHDISYCDNSALLFCLDHY